MRKTMLATLLALVMPAIALATPGPASAEMTYAPAALQAAVELTYTEPVRDGQRITWQWTAANHGDTAATDVVITHRITPAVPVTLTSPCEGTAEKITCTVGELPADEEFAGRIVAELPADHSDNARIQGRATWTDAPETA
ncbi:hypothetical protein AB0941_39805 [Streptomyces sp. NPDC013433]|uniref:hypothetical protein n=1 Tax=Streptomyces sp. NPDC013433 TaxID=3155604 RepID=UPI00345716F2